MTEPLDLDALECFVRDCGYGADVDVKALIAELRATRAERDHARTQEVAEQNVHHYWQLRAARAKAELARPMLSCQGDCLAHMDRLRHRAEAAEAECSKQSDRAEDWKERHHRERERARGAEAAEARIEELESQALDAWDQCNEDIYSRALSRAVRAEARILELNSRVLELGQAHAESKTRIAAARAWFARTDCTWAYRTEMARRALAGGDQ